LFFKNLENNIDEYREIVAGLGLAQNHNPAILSSLFVKGSEFLLLSAKILFLAACIRKSFVGSRGGSIDLVLTT